MIWVTLLFQKKVREKSRECHNHKVHHWNLTSLHQMVTLLAICHRDLLDLMIVSYSYLIPQAHWRAYTLYLKPSLEIRRLCQTIDQCDQWGSHFFLKLQTCWSTHTWNVRFSVINTNEISFGTSSLLSRSRLSEKGSTQKEKNLLSMGANSFILE